MQASALRMSVKTKPLQSEIMKKNAQTWVMCLPCSYLTSFPRLCPPFCDNGLQTYSGGLRIYFDQNFGKKEASKVT